MKTNILFTLAILLVAGCQLKAQDKPVDFASVRASISLVIDDYFKAVNTKDLEAYSSLLAEDGLICGTDPGEFWSKKEAVELMKQQFADPAFNWKLVSDKQEIKVSSDGMSAIVVNQYIITQLSPKIPMREITYVIKSGDRWLISFTGYNFVTENANVEILNKAL